MIKILLATSTLLVTTALSASAADMAVRPPPAPVYAAPVSNWTGFYIGVMGGYGWSDRVRASVGGVEFSTSSDEMKGGFVGGTIGYNFQIGGPLVFGIEADGAWSEIKHA